MTTKAKQKNYKIPALAVLFLVAMGFSFYLLKQNKSNNTIQFSPIPYTKLDTENVRLYSNSKYGFRFKYPLDYNLTELDDSVFQLSSPDDPQRKGERNQNSRNELEVEIHVSRVKENDSLDNFLADTLQVQHQVAEYDPFSVQPFSIAGLKSYRLISDTNEVYIIVNRNYRISIAKYPITTSLQGEFESILNSFEFF